MTALNHHVATLAVVSRTRLTVTIDANVVKVGWESIAKIKRPPALRNHAYTAAVMIRPPVQSAHVLSVLVATIARFKWMTATRTHARIAEVALPKVTHTVACARAALQANDANRISMTAKVFLV